VEPIERGGTVSVARILARDRDLREHATARPWHQDGQGGRFRLVGPLPRSAIVVDPYVPNPQDAPLLLHRVNTYERLEEEVERLRAALGDVRAQLEAKVSASAPRSTAEGFDSLARDLRARITAALGDERLRGHAASARRL
jgi:hypothetical protein